MPLFPRLVLVTALTIPLAAPFVSIPTVEAATLRVPGEFTRIQDAIDAASPGDLILVAAGIYPEALNTRGKRLDLASESGASTTIIDAQRLGSVVNLTAGGSVTGFTLRNGLAQEGGGIFIGERVAATVRDNIIEDNSAGLEFDSGNGGGIHASNGINVAIEHNIVRNNFSGYKGGGITLFGLGGCRISDNQIVSNAAYSGAGGVEAYDATISGNLIARNHATFDAGGIEVAGANVRVEQNTIARNSTDNGFENAAGLFAPNAHATTVIARNLIAENSSPNNRGIGLDCTAGQLECNNSWGNGVDYDLGTSVDTTGKRNVSLNPLFCAEPSPEFSIREDSPCAPAHSGGCGRIGARDVACGITSDRRGTWGEVKRRYR